MREVVLANTFAESKCVLKSGDHRPVSLADQYRAIGRRLNVDFSPAIRLLELLPVFLHGDRHAEVRRAMAIHLAAVRTQQEQAARQVVERLPALIVPGQTLDLLERFVRPLWDAVAEANSAGVAIPRGLATEINKLLDGRSRLRERLQTNDRIREFIASDPDSADQRLFVLGQNALGATPLIGTLTSSLHCVFSANLGKPLSAISYPGRFPVSALPVTDRTPVTASRHADSQRITRCVLHSPGFSAGENDELLYGVGEHTCLGRAISNAVWSMVTSGLSRLDATIKSSTLKLDTDAPETVRDLLDMDVFFIKPRSLSIEIGP